MIRRLAISAAFLATTVGMAVSSAPAAAQSRQDSARFEAAQQRLDSELAIFKREFDRYQQAKTGGAPDRESGERYEDPRVYGADSETGARDQYPSTGDDRARPESDDRSDREYEPQR